MATRMTSTIVPATIWKGRKAKVLPPEGLELSNSIIINDGEINPTTTGVEAPIGSKYYYILGDTWYRKVGANKTDWERERLEAGYNNSGLFGIPSYSTNGNDITIGQEDIVLYSTTDFSGERKKYTLAPATLTVPNDSQKYYIIADYNGGTPVYDIVDESLAPNGSNAFIVFSVFNNGAIHVLNWGDAALGAIEKIVIRLIETQRFVRISGLAVSEYGTRNIRITAGITWNGIARQQLALVESATDNMVFYFNTVGVWDSSTVTQWNNTQYDDGTDLVTLGDSKYGVIWFYRGEEDAKHIYMVLGNQEYDTLAKAQGANRRTDLPEIITSHAILCARAIFQKNATTFAELRSAFQEDEFGTDPITDHNDLSNIQGGATGEYFHLSSANYTDLTDGGDSTLHYHASDRNRANHTGTQLAATISDFDTAVSGSTHATTTTIHFTNPLTTKGDLWTRDGTSSVRLPVGTDGLILKADSAESSGLKWVAESTYTSPLTTKGDVLSHNGTNEVRLPAGTNGQVLTADSAEASGVKWATPEESPVDIGFIEYYNFWF